jgi:hypothetical protein
MSTLVIDEGVPGDARPCLVCSGVGREVARFAHSVTSEAKVLAHPSSLYRCERCGHLFSASALDLSAYYASEYDATLTDGGLDEIVSSMDGEVVFRTDLDYGLFRRLLGEHLHERSSVFEYGCGHGRILSRLVKDGVRDVRAYDLSEGYRAGVEAIIGEGRLTIGARPDPTGVDVACSFFVLEHDARPGDSLRYLRATLKDGGLLFVMVPSFETNLGDLACADHVNHFSPASLAALVVASGFEIITVDDTSAMGAVAVLARAVLRAATDVPIPETTTLEGAIEAGRDFVGYLQRLEGVVTSLDQGRPIFLYGAGFYAALTAAYLRSTGHDVAGLFDANPRKQGLVRLGRRVAAPEEATRREHGGASLIVCVNPRIGEQVARRFAPVFGTVHVA